jgi:hypothetical protein
MINIIYLQMFRNSLSDRWWILENIKQLDCSDFAVYQNKLFPPSGKVHEQVDFFQLHSK